MTANTQENPLTIIKNGLWYNNPGLVQLLGLCPLLAVSNSAISAIALGLATTIVLVISNVIISFCKSYLDYNLRIPYFMLIVASVVTCIILLLQAVSYELYQSLGVYLALITTNCVILGRIEAFAYRNSVSMSLWDGLANGLGFSLVLFILGSCRELIGHGTILANSHLLFGPMAQNLTFHLPSTFDYQFILALLPPGAFFTMGLLIAFKNYITQTKSNCHHHKTTPYEQKTNITDIPTLSRKKS